MNPIDAVATSFAVLSHTLEREIPIIQHMLKQQAERIKTLEAEIAKLKEKPSAD